MPRGRPQKSDPKKILHAAMNSFWHAGYNEISLNDLSKLTGMAKPGFYANFGDKQDLFIKTLEIYSESIAEPMLTSVLKSPAPISEVFRDLLIKIASTVTDADLPNGCFISVSFLDSDQLPDKVRAFSQSLIDRRLSVFRHRIEAAVKTGELDRGINIDALAQFFSGQALAVTGMARAGVDKETLFQLVDIAVSVLKKDKA